MGETLIQLGRELEIAVYGAGLFAPILPHMRPDMAVKRGVDLAAIEELRQIFERMELTSFKISGIDDPLPVLVGKARGSDVNAHSDARLLLFTNAPVFLFDRPRGLSIDRPTGLLTDLPVLA